MRHILLFLIVLPVLSQAQWKDYRISPRGDTLNRLDQKDLKQGPWVVRVESLRGEPGFEEEGFFEDGKKEGMWRKFNLQGDLIAIENYKYGYRHGAQQYFDMFGNLIREESWRAVNPENMYDTVEVPDLYNPMKTELRVIKAETAEYKHGIWKYYDSQSGSVVKTETFFLGKLENPNKQPEVTAERKPLQKPKEVLEYEKKNSGKKRIKVRDGSTGG